MAFRTCRKYFLPGLLFSLGSMLAPAQHMNWSAAAFDQNVFVENKGQFGQPVLFAYSGNGVQVFFTPKGIVYSYDEIEQPSEKERERGEHSHQAPGSPKVTHHLAEMNWEGASPGVSITGSEPVSYYFTYPEANDAPGAGSIKANACRKITYHNIYPNTDVTYILKEGGLKYTIILRPGADVSRIKMDYSGEIKTSLNKNGDLELRTAFGTITDHAPVTFYEGNTRNTVSSSFILERNTAAFLLGNYDHTQTLVIDPFTANPNFPTYNAAYDVEYDFAGNVYVYGGSPPYKEIKLNSAGVIQWVYTATLFTVAGYYGDFCVDGTSGSSYIAEAYRCCGQGTRVAKVNASGTQVGMFAGNPQMQEFWRVAFNNCTKKIILIGSSFVNSSYYQACTLDTNVSAISPSNVLGVNSINSTNDMCLLTLDNTDAYMANCGNKIEKVPASTLSPTAYQVPNNHAFTELNSIAYICNSTPRAIGMNGMAVSSSYLYTYDGKLLQRWNKNTGAFMNSVVISSTPFRWGGIAVDDCDHIFVGKHSSVVQYDTSFNVVSTIPMNAITDTVYDVRLAPGNMLYVCGLGFVSSIQLNLVCNPLTLNLSSIGSCSSTGSASVAASGGTGPYTYSWNPTGQTTATATGLPSGTYTVTVTDASCIPHVQSDTVTVTNSGNLTIVTSQNNLLCSNSANGSATVSPNGGQSPYTYSWSPSGGTDSTATGLSAGNYTVIITDNTGCSVTQTFAITAPPALIASATVNNIPCSGGTGSASANANGGTGPYTYSWSNGQTTSSLSGLSQGSYTVFVTDANGCTDTQSVSITEPPALTLTQTQVNICCNGSCNGSAGVTPAGGTAPYTYAWMPGSQTTSTVTGLCAGNYTCTVTDANGCSQVISCTITQPPVFASAASASTPAFCPGGCTNLNGSASGGILPYTYSWVPGNMTTSTVNVCPTATTTYTLFASDSGGCCISNVQVTVTVTQISIAASSTPSACASGTGTATATPSNGTSPYTYSWNNGQTSATATGLSPGTYTVTVTDANGCTQTQTVSVVVSGGPTAAASASNTTISPGDNTQLTASGGSTYSWYPSAGLSCTSCASPVATPAQTTTYCVLVTDANGCSDSACITISVEAPCLLESLNTLLPNAFSPNNDANNDQYCVPANVCIVSFTLKVYDRWGAKVFETSDMSTCWDGTYKGRPLNTDVFVYYFDALLSSGEEWHQKGNISLVK